MKRLFTYSFPVLFFMAIAQLGSAQCFTGGTFTPGATNYFSENAEGFTGDFDWVNGTKDLTSSPVADGTTKVLTTSTYSQPAGSPTMAWAFDLSGSANVTAFEVDALYYANGQIMETAVCSGGAIINGTNLTFGAMTPSEILGKLFQLRITFTISGAGAHTKTIDNFRVSAFGSNITLPVTFTWVSAKASGTGVAINWNVDAQVNVNTYEIERSANGRKYAKIGAVSAGSGQTSYSFFDAAPGTGTNYYRIKAVDLDGKYKYSVVVTFKNGKINIQLRAYPVPAGNEVVLQHDEVLTGTRITISTMDGRLVKSIIPATGVQQTSIDLSNTQPGLYLVRYLTAEGESGSLKLIKQ